MSWIDVVVPGEPIPQPRALPMRVGRFVRMYTPRSKRKDGSGGIAPWKEKVAIYLRRQYSGKPWKEPVAVHLTFYFDRTQELAKAKHGDEELAHAVRPDIDNLAKAIMDVMTVEKFWQDDGRVCDLHIVKRYVARGHQAGCRIAAGPITSEGTEPTRG